MIHAGFGLLCLSVGGGNNVDKAQGEWVACTVQKSIVFVGIVTACVVPCAACVDFGFWASQIFCLGVFLALSWILCHDRS